MSTPFLITGLPRSRTAWWAAMCCTGRALCLHEPTQHMTRWQDVYAQVWGRESHPFIGASDAGLGLHLAEICATQQNLRVLVVRRPLSDVARSAERAGVVPPLALLRALEARLRVYGLGIRHIPYAALKDDMVVARCLRHLMPGEPVDMAKVAAMQRLNIQCDMPKTLGSAAARVAEAAAFLGDDVMREVAG